MLRGVHQLEEPQLLRREGLRWWTSQRLGTIHYQRFLRIQRDEGALGRGKTGGVEDTVVNVADLALTPIISTAIFG